jgi:hypothetical protein
MVTPMLDAMLNVSLDSAHAAAVGAVVKVDLRLATVAVVEVDLASGAFEVDLRLATGLDVGRALEVTRRRAWPAADMRCVAVTSVSLVTIPSAGLGHREAKGHSGHEGDACG